MNNHIMLDFETWGQANDTVVLSLGAVVFNREQILKEKLWLFDLTSQLKANRSVTADTIVWWFNQGESAKTVISAAHKGGMLMDVFCNDFLFNFMTDVKDPRVWSNGANFDIPIIEHIFQTNKLAAPWKFWNARCYRTMKSLFRIENGIARSGVKHDALDDARYQAQCVIAYLKANPEKDL